METEKIHWYYNSGSKINGPVSLSELQSLLASGMLSSETLIWQPEFTNWTAARSIDALFINSLSVSEDKWLYTSSGVECGPVSNKAIRQLITENSLKPSEQIRRVNSPLWISIDDIIDTSGKQPPALPGNKATAYSKEQKRDLPYANVNKRAFAFLIDIALILAIENFVMLLHIPATKLLLGMLYFSIMESSVWQATIGKRVFKLVVTKDDGSSIALRQAIIRYYAKYLSAILLGFGFILALITERKQGLHDLLANTYVLDSSSKPNQTETISENLE